MAQNISSIKLGEMVPKNKACRMSTSAQVVYKWHHLAWPGRQPAGNHHMAVP